MFRVKRPFTSIQFLASDRLPLILSMNAGSVFNVGIRTLVPVLKSLYSSLMISNMIWSASSYRTTFRPLANSCHLACEWIKNVLLVVLRLRFVNENCIFTYDCQFEMNHPNFVVQIDPSLVIRIDAHVVRSLQRRLPTICRFARMRRSDCITYNPEQAYICCIGSGCCSSSKKDLKKCFNWNIFIECEFINFGFDLVLYCFRFCAHAHALCRCVAVNRPQFRNVFMSLYFSNIVRIQWQMSFWLLLSRNTVYYKNFH